MDRRLVAPRWLASRWWAPSWWALHLVVLVAVVGCTLLGLWQLDRAKDQRAQSVRPASNVSIAPVDLAELLPPGGRLAFDDIGRRVRVSGTYDTTHQLLVPDREADGAIGALVLTPLVPDAGGPAVIVVRGLLPTVDGGEPDGAVPPAPAGEVSIEGWLGAAEPAPEAELLPPGQVGSVHLATIVNLVPYELADAFVAQTDSSADGLVALPPPIRIQGGGLPLQNLVYAAEWWLFGLAALAFWVTTVRRRDEPGATTPSGPEPADLSQARS